MSTEYELVVGLEVHAELSTKTKIYCNCTTEFGGEPNTHCCPICTGMPGTLPVLNEKVVEYAVKAGLAMNCDISRISKQDRKNYFYPDLPKAYQISQFDIPLCTKGHIDIVSDGVEKTIGITRIHIEEDAGKLNHDPYSNSTMVDLNRAGVPLIEIVSEPDMRSSSDVKAYLEKIKSILEYLEVSDCKMEQGSLRADVNVSVRPKGSKEFGTRTEMKNLSSFRGIIKAVDYEFKRQVECIERGETIHQDTMRWDEFEEKTTVMRTKENANDYRYFPEPDLLGIRLSDEYIENVRKTIPELPDSRRKKYVEEYGLPEYDAGVITSSKKLADFFEIATKESNKPKAVSNWIMGELLRIVKEKYLDLETLTIPFEAKYLGDLINLVEAGTINGLTAKKVFEEMFETGKDPKVIVEEKGLSQISDQGAIEALVEKVLANNPSSIADYKAGKDRALGFLVGQAMKESKGKANPQMLNKMILERIK